MANYNFKELSSYDFEILSRDLLQEEFGVTIESFKTGIDNGIDLRYAKDENNSFIVQCKHYLNSTFSNLKITLKNEVKKIVNLNCKRYILVTSMSLTPNNKDEILNILHPYCKSTGDILGQDDLNNLISKYPKVERDNYKLWLTSSNLMDKILHSKVYNQSTIEIESIMDKSKFYVQNKCFFKAKELLKELNYCIITGIPGIGKTTLAEVLVIHYMDKEFEVYKIVNSIDEAMEVYNPNKKQIFYYDDFLGQTNLEKKLNKNEDSQILKFIETVNKGKNSKFILTTREYILNQAKLTYEKLSNFDFDISRCTINLMDYTKFDKAKILFNHIYFSGISNENKEKIISNRKYKNIINHPNYNPRIIELMTVRYIKKGEIDYYEEFISVLNNPHYIWSHIYDNQLKYYSKNLLLILITLPKMVYIEELQESFEVLNKYKAKEYGYAIGENDFVNALKELDGNFIKTKKLNNCIFVQFSNPSIRDFMECCLLNNSNDFKMLLKNSIYFTQIQRLFTTTTKESKELLFDYSKELEESIRKNFTSGDLSVMIDNKYLMNSSYPLSSRLVDVVNIIKINSNIYNSLVEDLFLIMIDSLNFEYLEECIYDLRKLEDIGFKYLVHRSTTVNKILKIISNIKYQKIEEFIVVKDIQRLYPYALSEEAYEFIRNKFEENLEDIVDYEIDGIDDLEGLEEVQGILRKLGDFFEVGVLKELEYIDIKVSELLKGEDRDIYDDYDEDDFMERRLDERTQDKMIDDMFDSLFD